MNERGRGAATKLMRDSELSQPTIAAVARNNTNDVRIAEVLAKHTGLSVLALMGLDSTGARIGEPS
ncbi:MAG: hypothetical protein O7G84_13575 [Gammaproteobacteria bacterium]|nr:hypothetical protein [Gammaproteobacteria bacterium]